MSMMDLSIDKQFIIFVFWKDESSSTIPKGVLFAVNTLFLSRIIAMISGQYIKKLAENAGFDLCGITLKNKNSMETMTNELTVIPRTIGMAQSIN